MKQIQKWLAAAAFAATIAIPAVTLLPGQTTDATKTDSKRSAKKKTDSTAAPAASTKKAASAPTPTASAADIAAAKASGKVWCNTETKVYHKDGKYYGATKKGKFMTEADAQKAGCRASKSS